MLEIERAAAPVFCKVEVWEALVVPTVWFANVRVVGVRVTAAAAPVPESATVCGLPAALSVTETVAPRLPVAVGVKVTEMVHVAAAASVPGHVFVCA